MPPTPIRLLMDKNGQNLGEKVAFDAFNRQLTRSIATSAASWSPRPKPVIHGLIGKGKPLPKS